MKRVCFVRVVIITRQRGKGWNVFVHVPQCHVQYIAIQTAYHNGQIYTTCSCFGGTSLFCSPTFMQNLIVCLLTLCKQCVCISCLFRDIDKYLYLYGSLVSRLSTSSAILTHELTRNKKLQQKVATKSWRRVRYIVSHK